MKNSQSFSLFFFRPPPPDPKRRTLSLLNVATPKQGMFPYRYRHFEHSVLKFEYLLFVILLLFLFYMAAHLLKILLCCIRFLKNKIYST